MEGAEAFTGNQYTLLSVVFLGTLMLTSVAVAINAFLIGYLWLRYYAGWSTYNQYAVTTGVFMLGAWFVLAIGGSILLVRERRAKQMGQFPQLLTVILLALIGFANTAVVASLGLADAQRTLTTDLMIVRTYFGTLLGLSSLCLIWLLIGGTIAMKRAKRTFDAVAQPPPVVLDQSITAKAATMSPEDAKQYIKDMTADTTARLSYEQNKEYIERNLKRVQTQLGDIEKMKSNLKDINAQKAALEDQYRRAVKEKAKLERDEKIFTQLANAPPRSTRAPPQQPRSTRAPPPPPPPPRPAPSAADNARANDSISPDTPVSNEGAA